MSYDLARETDDLSLPFSSEQYLYTCEPKLETDIFDLDLNQRQTNGVGEKKPSNNYLKTETRKEQSG